MIQGHYKGTQLFPWESMVISTFVCCSPESRGSMVRRIHGLGLLRELRAGWREGTPT